MKKKLTEQILCAVLIGLVAGAVTWLTNGLLRILALAVLYFVELDVFVSIVKLVLKEPELPKNPPEARIRAEDEWYLQRQDPAVMVWMRRVGWVIHGVAWVAAFLAMFSGAANPVCQMICIGCSLLSLALCILFPAYFSLGHMEEEKGRKLTFPIVNLMMPFMITPGVGILTFFVQASIEDWMRLLEVSLIIVAVMGAVLRLALPEFRRAVSSWVCAMLLFWLTSIGYVLPLNQVLERDVQIVTATVVSYDPGGAKNAADYTMELDNGEEVVVPLGGFEPTPVYRIGQRIELEYHPGGLGIEYYTYAD